MGIFVDQLHVRIEQPPHPGPVVDLRAEFNAGDSYLIFFRIPRDVPGLKYHILVGGCVPGARRITVTGWGNYFYRVVYAGTNGRTRAFGAEGVNRNGTGPCVEVMTEGVPN